MVKITVSILHFGIQSPSKLMFKHSVPTAKKTLYTFITSFGFWCSGK